MPKKIKIAIVGIGNCAKSLIEGISYYTKYNNEIIGLMHPYIGDYQIGDIEIVAAFDVDQRKVGKFLHEAIYAEPNKTLKICDVPSTEVIVQRGPTLDSIISEMRAFYIKESNENVVNVSEELKKANAEIVINYLPTGSIYATYAYANAALEAGCSFINCIPTPLGTNTEWREKFEQKGLVLIGDDVKSQVGATILNRQLLHLLKIRGAKIEVSSQVNYGGNGDHFNLRYRPDGKEESKKAALQAFIDDGTKLETKMVYTPENFDHKEAKILIEARIFGNIPVRIELKLDDEDSPNSGGVVVDAIRMVRLLIENEKVDERNVNYIAAFLMKNPVLQLPEDKAIFLFNKIIEECSISVDK